jgi:hypothetical protein
MNMNVLRQCLTVILLLALAGDTHASRMHRPMGDYVRDAQLIVLADTRKGGERGHDRFATVREVIKGDPNPAGTEITLPLAMSTADVRVPTPATGLALLMTHDEAAKKQWRVLEAYAKPEEISAVRKLVEVYAIAGERKQLLALREKAVAGDPYCIDQLLSDLAKMRDPANFDLMPKTYATLAPAHQAKLVETMARTNDSRAVPTLIEAMQSSRKSQRHRGGTIDVGLSRGPRRHRSF